MRIDKSIQFPLYRFTRKEWAARFFNTGEIRLGTLFDYAKNESYGDAIYDRHEGYYIHRKKWMPPGVPGIGFTLARNNLVLCASTDYDEIYYEKFNADCCIVIRSEEFYTAIDNTLKDRFTSLLLRRVTYYDKSRWDCIPDYEDFAGIMKDVSFAYQREVRALWEPRDYPLDSSTFRFPRMESNTLSNPLIDLRESEWYLKRISEELEWLKPTFVFAPEAINHCSLIER